MDHYILLSDCDKKSFSSPINLINLDSDITLRSLCPDDVPELKKLCTEWFPVDYPDSWYNDISSSSRFYTTAAIHKQVIIGMIVAEIKLKVTTDQEDCYILSNKHEPSTQVTYVLSLGVEKQFRRLGIASLLLDSLMNYLKTQSNCKAVYLHVLSSNKTAINFYEKRNFQKRIYLPRYYTIKGNYYDGYCYVYYMNDGEPPWTLFDCMNFSLEVVKTLNPFNLVQYFNRLIRNIFLFVTTNPKNKDFYRIS